MNWKRFSLSLTFAICLMAGCSNDTGATLETHQSSYYGYQIVKIDSCEYIKGTYSSVTPLTHKGNCNNLIHKK